MDGLTLVYTMTTMFGESIFSMDLHQEGKRMVEKPLTLS